MTLQVKKRIEQIRRGEVPEGYKRTKAGIMPLDWCAKKEYKAKDVFKSVTNKKHNGEFEVLSATQERGVVPRSQVDIDIKYDEANITGYKKVDRGDFVISLRSFQGGIEYSEYEGLVSPAYTVLKSVLPICDGYYRAYLKSVDYISRLNKGTYGIRDGKQIGFEDFGDMVVHYPPIAEQERIAEILSAKDKLIALKERLIEEKKRQKKALMQQLLTGKKRLPGFSGEWKTIKLSQISQKITEKNTDFKFNIVFSNSAQNGIIPQTEQFDKDIANDENIDKYYVVPRGCFVYNPRISVTAPCGPINVNHNTYTGVMSPLYTVFSVNSELIDNDYLEQYFKSTIWFRYMNSIANYGARHDRMSITDDYFFNMPIKVGGGDEQYAIKKILVAADKEIEILQKELDQEKQKKKALMQLLLTGIVRV